MGFSVLSVLCYQFDECFHYLLVFLGILHVIVVKGIKLSLSITAAVATSKPQHMLIVAANKRRIQTLSDPKGAD